MDTQRPHNAIYSDWALSLLRDLGSQANCDRDYATWNALDICLDLNEDARKRALKQKRGRGFPKDYDVYLHIYETLVQLGGAYSGPLPFLDACRSELEEHGVHIAEVDSPAVCMCIRWSRTRREDIQCILRKSLTVRDPGELGLLDDERAFLDTCAAIASHCRIEASPNDIDNSAQPASCVSAGPNASRPESPSTTTSETGPHDEDPASAPPSTPPHPFSYLIPLLRGVPCSDVSHPSISTDICDDGLGPVDFNLPEELPQLLERILPSSVLDAQTGLPSQELLASWLASDCNHRFSILVGKCRMIFTPLCDTALLATRIKRLFGVLAETSACPEHVTGMVAVLVRTSNGDEARLLAGTVLALALGPDRVDFLQSILNR